jgi:NAD(P)-dependent dehydrogenase (short-subunit alcohol dehydrogenase family)
VNRWTTTSYTAAKHRVIGIAKSLAIDLGPHNIRVNSILPGPLNTPLNDNPVNRDYTTGFKGSTMEDFDAAVRGWTNLRGRGALHPSAIANAALWLASDEAEHVHGTEIAVDAGHASCPASTTRRSSPRAGLGAATRATTPTLKPEAHTPPRQRAPRTVCGALYVCEPL